MKENFRATLTFKVRDYECDLQGVVNNGVYNNYFEHARHELLLEAGVNFAELAKNGVNLVLVRSEINYRYPLRSGDEFWVGSNVHKISPIRFEFAQFLYITTGNRLSADAKNVGIAVNRAGRPMKHTIPELAALLDTR